jgi:hypothetical protein
MTNKWKWAVALAATPLLFACGDSSTSAAGMGSMTVKMTDAPFAADSVQSVNVFVVRVDGRTADVDSATADANVTDGSNTDGWTTLGAPNQTFDLVKLTNGASVTLGQNQIAAGTYQGFRLVIDQSKSSVTLKDGTVLTGTSSPGIVFPSGSRSGIKIVLSQPVVVNADGSTTLLVDFDLANSFVLRGNTIASGGLLFKPVIRASVTAQ